MIGARLIWSCVFLFPFNKSNITKSLIGLAKINIIFFVKIHRGHYFFLYISHVKFKNDNIMTKKLNRYEMSYSQADCAWMVVYASSYEEAVEKFENGEYEIES